MTLAEAINNSLGKVPAQTNRGRQPRIVSSPVAFEKRSMPNTRVMRR
jgi:hypothetical protein